MRLFVAVDIPHDIRESLGALIRELQDQMSGVRWVRPEGIHLTLRFLGEVAEERLETLRGSLRRAAAAVTIFGVEVAGAGTFPPGGRPRVVCVSLREGTGTLSLLQAGIERAVREAGFPAEGRPFRPHLTLGRVRSGRTPRGLQELLRPHERGSYGRFEVSAVSLMQSVLGREGARYTRLEEFSLPVSREGSTSDSVIS